MNPFEQKVLTLKNSDAYKNTLSSIKLLQNQVDATQKPKIDEVIQLFDNLDGVNITEDDLVEIVQDLSDKLISLKADEELDLQLLDTQQLTTLMGELNSFSAELLDLQQNVSQGQAASSSPQSPNAGPETIAPTTGGSGSGQDSPDSLPTDPVDPATNLDQTDDTVVDDNATEETTKQKLRKYGKYGLLAVSGVLAFRGIRKWWKERKAKKNNIDNNDSNSDNNSNSDKKTKRANRSFMGKAIRVAGGAVVGAFGLTHVKKLLTGEETLKGIWGGVKNFFGGDIHPDLTNTNDFQDKKFEELNDDEKQIFKGLAKDTVSFNDGIYAKEISAGWDPDSNKIFSVIDDSGATQEYSLQEWLPHTFYLMNGMYPKVQDALDETSLQGLLINADTPTSKLIANVKILPRKLLSKMILPALQRLKSWTVMGIDIGKTPAEQIEQRLNDPDNVDQKREEFVSSLRGILMADRYLFDLKQQLLEGLVKKQIPSNIADDDKADRIEEHIEDDDRLEEQGILTTMEAFGQLDIASCRGFVEDNLGQINHMSDELKGYVDGIDGTKADILGVNDEKLNNIETLSGQELEVMNKKLSKNMLDPDIGFFSTFLTPLKETFNTDGANSNKMLDMFGALVNDYQSTLDGYQDEIDAGTVDRDEYKSFINDSFALQKEIMIASYTLGDIREDNPDLLRRAANSYLSVWDHAWKVISGHGEGLGLGSKLGYVSMGLATGAVSLPTVGALVWAKTSIFNHNNIRGKNLALFLPKQTSRLFLNGQKIFVLSAHKQPGKLLDLVEKGKISRPKRIVSLYNKINPSDKISSVYEYFDKSNLIKNADSNKLVDTFLAHSKKKAFREIMLNSDGGALNTEGIKKIKKISDLADNNTFFEGALKKLNKGSLDGIFEIANNPTLLSKITNYASDRGTDSDKVLKSLGKRFADGSFEDFDDLVKFMENNDYSALQAKDVDGWAKNRKNNKNPPPLTDVVDVADDVNANNMPKLDDATKQKYITTIDQQKNALNQDINRLGNDIDTSVKATYANYSKKLEDCKLAITDGTVDKDTAKFIDTILDNTDLTSINKMKFLSGLADDSSDIFKQFKIITENLSSNGTTPVLKTNSIVDTAYKSLKGLIGYEGTTPIKSVLGLGDYLEPIMKKIVSDVPLKKIFKVVKVVS